MATFNIQPFDITGAALTFSAASGGGDAYVPTSDDRTFLCVKNGGGGSITVTITVPGQTYGVNNTDLPVVVGPGVEKMIGPLTKDLFVSDETFGFVAWGYSGVTSVTVAVARLGDPVGFPPTG